MQIKAVILFITTQAQAILNTLPVISTSNEQYDILAKSFAVMQREVLNIDVYA